MLKSIRHNSLRRATVISVLTGICGQGTVLVSGILAARILGVEDRGYLALLAVFPALCSHLVNLGFPIAITYQIAANPNQLSIMAKLARRMFVMQVLVLVIAHGMIVWLFLAMHPDFQPTTAYVTLLVSPAMLALQYGVAFLQGLGRFQSLNVLRALLPSTYTVLVLALFLLEAGNLQLITIVWVLSSLFAGGVALELVRRMKNPRGELDPPEKSPSQKEMLKFGLKSLFGSTSPLETFRLDQLVAGLILAPSALGLYVVGGAFGTLARLIAQSAGIVAYPTVVNRRHGEAGRETIWRFFWAVTFVNGLITVFLVISVPWLIPVLFGEEFLEAILLSQILLIGAGLASSRRILVEGLLGLGKPQVSTLAEVLMYPWFFTAGVLLVWHYGIVGLAIAVSTGYGLSLAIAVGFGLKIQREFSLSMDLDDGNSLIPPIGSLKSYEKK